ncbi:hypothetical protein HanRHA438_Chr14g0658821 [Helianthus annuus]|nr:hypothetical protein HanIR_Chr14g0703191 [Helianthus annuus]KAJ0854101.1 hypothetical protein HanRHA438_Chr14g0658821 [Helianthus annuus]
MSNIIYAVNIGDISDIGPHVKYQRQISVPILSAILTDIPPIFPVSVPFFLALPYSSFFLLLPLVS